LGIFGRAPKVLLISLMKGLLGKYGFLRTYGYAREKWAVYDTSDNGMISERKRTNDSSKLNVMCWIETRAQRVHFRVFN